MPLKAVAAALSPLKRGSAGGGADSSGALSSRSNGPSLSKKPKHGASGSGSGSGSARPRLIQRTSSVDGRKDVSHLTWTSLLSLLKIREYFVTVDHFSIWRRHLSWAKEDGAQLRTLMTQKFSTNMVFMSLLLGAELNVLFNSSHITTKMREDMRESNHSSFEFWIGLWITTSVVLTLFTLLSTFTAWGMVSAVSDQNAHCVLRSSIGQYVCYLPSKLIVTAIYSFLLWMVMFLFILLPHLWSYILLVLVLALFFHIVTVFSAFGRLILHSGAMGTSRIFDPDFESELLPRGLHTSLLFKATDELRKGTSVTRQYRDPARPIGTVDEYDTSDEEEDDLALTASSRGSVASSRGGSVASSRGGSVAGGNGNGGGGGVRFADQQNSERGEDLSHTESAADVLPETAMQRWISTDSASSFSQMFPPPPGIGGKSASAPAPLSSSSGSGGSGIGGAGGSGGAFGGVQLPPVTNPPQRGGSLSAAGAAPMATLPPRRGGSLSSSSGGFGRPPKAARPGGPMRSSATKRASFQDEQGGDGNRERRRTSSRSPSPRPSLMAEKLNWGNHTAKSLRRLEVEMTDPDDAGDDGAKDGSGENGGGAGGGENGAVGAEPVRGLELLEEQEDQRHLSLRADSEGNYETVEYDIQGGGGGGDAGASGDAGGNAGAGAGASFESDEGGGGSLSSRESPPKLLPSGGGAAPLPTQEQPRPQRPRPRPGPSLLRQSSYARRVAPANGGAAAPPPSRPTRGRSPSPYQSDSDTAGAGGSGSGGSGSPERAQGDGGRRGPHPLLRISPKKKKSPAANRVRTNTADIVDIVRRSLHGDWDAMGRDGPLNEEEQEDGTGGGENAAEGERSRLLPADGAGRGNLYTDGGGGGDSLV